MRYPARVNVDVIYCELCNNPYRRAAGACDNCGQSGGVDWDALADEARSLRVYVIGGFGLALLGLVITFTVTRGAMLLLVLPIGFGGVHLQRLLAIQRLLKKRTKPEVF